MSTTSQRRRTMVAEAQRTLDSIQLQGRPPTREEREHVEGLILEAQVLKVGEAMASPVEGESDRGLSDALLSAGFDRISHPSVVVPFAAATFGAAASFDGDYGTAVRVNVASPTFGADRRFLFPTFPQLLVESDATSISSFRQKSRTLPVLSSMVRDIVAVSTKPETATQTELVVEELHQIATVESAIPNIMLESDAFRGWINDDLAHAYSSAVDYHLVTQIAAANPTTATPGANFLETIVAAAEVVAAKGYMPSVLAASPEDLIALRLMPNIGTDGGYLAGGMDMVLSGLRRVAVPALTSLGSAYVIDPSAAGTFYSGPVRMAAFEENSGKTNTSTVRIESNGLFLVQRIGAIAEVAVSS